MAVNVFLKIENIVGESTDSQHQGWIEVVSFSWGVSQPAYRSGGSNRLRAAARPAVQNFHVVKQVDKTTPQLVLDCVSGKLLKIVELEMSKAAAGGQPQSDFLGYKFFDCFIASNQVIGKSSDDGLPLEEVGFVFNRFEVDERTIAATGEVLDSSSVSWDVVAARSL